jgi:hypothetical protein
MTASINSRLTEAMSASINRLTYAIILKCLYMKIAINRGGHSKGPPLEAD